MQLGDRELVRVGEDLDLPLTGALPFGIIDRGTNLFQIRPVSGCNLCCPFCSVDEGPVGDKAARYEVSLDYLIEYAGALVERKNSDRIEMHIDGCGEPALYPKLAELVQRLSKMEDVEIISMQTNGTLLDGEKIDELDEAGMSRINLTLNSLNEKTAEKLAGREDYQLGEVLSTAETIDDSEIDLLLAPVWVKGLNGEEIERIVEYGKDIGAGGKWPALGIQKYREHKNGRKVEDSEEIPWEKFYSKLRKLEKKHETKLRLKSRDFGTVKSEFALPVVMDKGEKLGVKIKAQGWNPGQKLGVARHRTVTIVNAEEIPLGREISIEIMRNRHNLYVAKPTR